MESNTNKRPRWENDNWVGTMPPDDICCKDCVFREADRKFSEKSTIKGHTLGICQVFTHGKPDDVLWHKARCSYYVSEKD